MVCVIRTRQHVAERLRQHDVAHRLRIIEPKRAGRGGLSARDRLDAGTHDLGEVRGLEHDERDERGCERADADRARRAGQPLPEIGYQEVEPEDDQHQRQRAHEVDIDAGDAAQDLEAREPHQRECRAEDQAAKRGECRQRKRKRHALVEQIGQRADNDAEIEIAEHGAISP
ncbi:hypothetical protein ABIF78_006564 [Bradyrhizobium japonicum]